MKKILKETESKLYKYYASKKIIHSLETKVEELEKRVSIIEVDIGK